MPPWSHYRKPLATARSVAALSLVLASVGLAACGEGPDGDRTSPLAVSVKDYDFGSAPDLLDRLRERPHTYFRFINREFTQEVCRRYSGMVDRLPRLNLHGDAHLEQYAVTDSGRGLTDFDDSAVGPAIVDLVRLGTSISLTAEANGWTGELDRLLDAMFAGLRQGVNSPNQRPPPPALVRRIREGFSTDRLSILQAMDSLMTFEGSRDSFRLEAGLDLYRESMLAEYPDLPPGFFTMKRGGRLTVGVGSALDNKFLLRIEGMTSADDDDLVLEAKPVRDLSGVQCLERRPGDAFQIMTGQARIAYQPYQYMGYVFLDPRRVDQQGLGPDFWDGSTYWIHAWVDNYVEVDIRQSFASVAELEEVVFDIGVQLGRGHPKDIAAPHEFQLRRALSQWLDDHEHDVRAAIAEMTVLVEAAWEEFRLESADWG